ncbi:MAG: hypothetical protein KKE12_16285 [Proteobacteria bacterium]|nr:hypothetical protein [Pseudomonadota bacterium]
MRHVNATLAGIYMPAGSKHSVQNVGAELLVFFSAYDRPHYTTTLDE